MNNIVIAGDLGKAAFAKLMALPQFAERIQKTEKILRFEVNLENGKTSYTLDLLASTGSGDRPLENKLEKDSMFAFAAIAVGVQNSTDASGTNQASSPLYHHPETTLTAGEKAGINALYNGTLSLKVGNVDRYDAVSMSLLKFDPGTDNYTFGPTLQEKGFHFINPGGVLDGRERNIIQIEIPPNQDLTGIKGAAQNVLVVELYGWETKGNEASGLTC